MDETGGTEHVPYARVTVAEAAAILGVNVVTVRRMIKRGQLEAERVHRPQGSAYLVKLPGHGAGDATPTEQPAQDMSRTQGTTTPPGEAIAAMIQATLAPIVAPLVGELQASRQTIESQAGEIAELREERGRQSAELERTASIAVTLSDELEAVKTEYRALVARVSEQSLRSAADGPVRGESPQSAGWGWGWLVLLLAAVVGVPLVFLFVSR